MKKLAKKRFGQHFLHDPNIINQIIQHIQPEKDDIIVEIGPGPGALTIPLITHLKQLHVIEIDRDWAARLPGSLAIHNPGSQNKLVLHNQDVLKFNFKQISSKPESIRLVGNLPYNISTPIMFHLVRYSHLIKDMVFMFQKEVAQRICAAPNQHAYGRLSVMMQYFFETQIIMQLAPGAFKPPPKVDSAIVRFTPKRHQQTVDAAILKLITTTAFNQRRKTIRNTLKKLFTEQQLIEAGINPALRPENLSLEQYIQLCQLYQQRTQ